jgi:hypothetical protein
VALAFNLNLPQDIPWKRICVTRDMIDRIVCDVNLPAKWQTSLAVFEYVPEEEFQLYPDYNITYLKVTATITGYQPLSEEIQGDIDWDDVNVETIEGLTELLQSYHPCHGAILQVVVGPERRHELPAEQYPFFLDFEPKKRELYEMATDTNERSSRSLEAVSLGKSGGSTQSTEVLDVDMGGSTSGGLQIPDVGGFTFSSSSNGQWGTKSLNTQQSQWNRTTDVGQEKRESHSFSTQISQMYHLLDSYHLGTNRAVFFVQPRPHVLEEPSGFVRGPRPVDGIQEFLLVVAQPKDQPEFCVGLRLDTSHLAETDILDYDERTEISDLASAVARVPTKEDIPDGTTTRRACFITCWDVTYLCFRTHAVDDQVYQAPDGYVIVGYDDLVNDASRGSTSVSIAPGGKTLTVHAEASGHICFEDSGLCLDCPDEIDKWSGYARRQVQVRLRSEEPIKKVGTKQVLLITTRGLCCCDSGPVEIEKPVVTVIKDLPILDVLSGFGQGGLADPKLQRYQQILSGVVAPGAGSYGADTQYAASQRRSAAASSTWSAASGGHAGEHKTSAEYGCQCGGKKTAPAPDPSAVERSDRVMLMAAAAERRMTVQVANQVNHVIREEMIKSFNNPRTDVKPRPFHMTDAFFVQLGGQVRRSKAGRKLLARPLRDMTSGNVQKIAEAVAKRLNKTADTVTASDLLRLQTTELETLTKVPYEEIARLKLTVLGVAAKPRPDETRGSKKDKR